VQYNCEFVVALLEEGMLDVLVEDDHLIPLFRNELNEIAVSLDESHIVAFGCPVARLY